MKVMTAKNPWELGDQRIFLCLTKVDVSGAHYSVLFPASGCKSLLRGLNKDKWGDEYNLDLLLYTYFSSTLFGQELKTSQVYLLFHRKGKMN